MGTSDTDGFPSLTNKFNNSSIGGTLKHVLKHVVVMGVMMGVIGLASPAFAAATPIDPLSMDFTEPLGRTPGDLIVQSAHGSWEMLSMIVDTFEGAFSIGGDLINNLLEGNFMPSTWDSLIMSHDASGHVAAAAGHGVIEHTSSIAFDEWLRNAMAEGTLEMALEDSQAMGLTLEEYISKTYGHEGH